jgi:acyl-CoA thioesterase
VGVPPGDFLVDTYPEPVAGRPGRYFATIPEAWNVFSLFGGVSMAFALRAAEAELDRPELQPVSASAIFCSPLPFGRVDAEVEVLRSGRTAAQAVTSLWVPEVENPALRLQATFGLARDVRSTVDAATRLEFVGVERPDVPAPLDCEPPPAERPPDDPFPVINFHDQTDWRPALPQRTWDPEVRAASGGVPAMAAWTRLQKSPRDADGDYDWSALCIPGDQLGGAVGRAIGESGGPFFVLTLELSIRFVARPDGEWILMDGHGWVARDGYATGDVFLWDEPGNLCAVATQTAFLKPFDPAGQP